MGLLATAALANRNGDAEPVASRDLAALPKGHPLQRRPRLHAGLRTGLCGALTTFSGWNQVMAERAAAGRWARALVGFLLGAELFVSSLVVGQHVAAWLGAHFDRRDAAAAAAAEAEAEVKAAAAAAGGRVAAGAAGDEGTGEVADLERSVRTATMPVAAGPPAGAGSMDALAQRGGETAVATPAVRLSHESRPRA